MRSGRKEIPENLAVLAGTECWRHSKGASQNVIMFFVNIAIPSAGVLVSYGNRECAIIKIGRHTSDFDIADTM